MSDMIPSELVREILLRLPAKSLLRLRSVCKEWRSVIDDASFIRSHTNIQLSSPTLLITCDYDLFYHSESQNFTDRVQTIDAAPIHWEMLERNMMSMIRWMKDCLIVSHPCNGLILMFDSSLRLDYWVIANPLTQKYHELPAPALDDADRWVYDCGVYGFGYDYAADDYKVVWIDKRRRTQIYSLKSNSWRLIGDFCPNCVDRAGVPLNCPTRFDSEGVYLNGALHWQIEEGIVVLDLGTEDYRLLLPLPPVPETAGPPVLYLETFGGRLFCFNQSVPSYGGWVMNEYGIGKSWTMLFSVKLLLSPPEEMCDVWRPVAYFEREKRLLLLCRMGLLWVDTESGSAEEVTVNGVSRIKYARLCSESLFPLGGTTD